jgi:nicotinate-nucleotide adenylyltransferase
MKKRKIGLFGGTFDPIHFGHLNLALTLLETQKLDQVIFCPAHTSPLKKDEPPSFPAEARAAMVALAIEPIKEFLLLDWEISRPAPSFTIDTVRYLLTQKEYSSAQLHLILGEDSVQTLERWKEVDELLKIAPPLIGSRVGHLKAQLSPKLSKVVEAGLVRIPTMEVSSTEIRRRLKEHKYCGHLVPAKVLEYIYNLNG